MIILLIIVRSTHQELYSCDETAVCGCSSNFALVNRIVGGEQAGTATWSWTVSLAIANSRLCGGSIISSSWIITAAHCVYDLLQSPITVYAGSTIRWSGTQTRMVSQIIVHPGFNADTFVNDISLLQLDSPLNMSDSNVSTICMPLVSSSTLESGEWPPSNTSVITVGWGRLSDGGTLPTNLQQVTLETIDYRDPTCSVLLTDEKLQLCASVPGGIKGSFSIILLDLYFIIFIFIDSCQGDSGGPLMMFSPSNQWILVGLTSSGHGCATPTYSGIYTRIVAYKDWIQAYTDESYWIDVNHGNSNSISKICFISIVTLIFFKIFHQ
ncbi:unnamed protein product [Adineta steineri]|uniref:Peptidase S1 domain-containing protein n=1 Tax=Adineta steineri TaxID=433720 RepID=A0A815RYD6_9BILA|nr:unnamed protein product [Adineta steineri]CAF1483241.1 unnamed protein product [Adineta steineri]